MNLDLVEKWVRRAAVVGMGAFLAMVYQGLWRASRHSKGRTVGQVPGFVSQSFSPATLPISAVSFGLLYRLWRPIRLPLSAPARVGALVTGGALYFSGLAVMLWGRRTLGGMYNLSTSMGAQLYADHQLVTSGPYAFVRHPMYLAGQAAELGALLIFRNWTTALIALNIPLLALRARREEQALAAEFGEQWAKYTRRTPAWIPRLRK